MCSRLVVGSALSTFVGCCVLLATAATPGGTWCGANNGTDPADPFLVLTPTVWGAGCLLALLALLASILHSPLASIRMRGFYTMYLQSHIIASACGLHSLSPCAPRAVRILGTLATLCGGMTYVIIGTILVWPASHRAQNAAVALAAFAYVPLASTIVAMDIRGGAGSIFIVFGAYLVAAVWACLGVGLMLRRHPHAWQMRLFVVGAAFGMVALCRRSRSQGAIWRPGSSAASDYICSGGVLIRVPRVWAPSEPAPILVVGHCVEPSQISSRPPSPCGTACFVKQTSKGEGQEGGEVGGGAGGRMKGMAGYRYLDPQ